jgi:three-Cys-motif partner protein
VNSNNSLAPIFQDDGFAVTAAEPWVIQKIGIAREYLTAFVEHLAGKVDDIIVVDLFAGNGLYGLGSKRELYPGLALTALSLDLPINKFVFCESDPEQSGVLKIRVNKYFRGKNVALLEGEPGELIDRLNRYVPQSKGSYKVAVFCLCDPFSLELSFDTLRTLADRGFTFLIPFTFALNTRLDYRHYIKENRERIKRFLGNGSDVERLEKDLTSNTQLYKRMMRMYETNVLSIGLNTTTSVHKLDSGLMEMPFYYMGFFSKPFSTKAIQDGVEASRNVQFSLF